MDKDVQDLLEKSEQSSNAADLLLRDGYIDFSASRSYYAMFYAAEALLLAEGLAFSKHSAVISAFGKLFVKTGIMEPRFHRHLLDAFDLRNIGDYGTMHSVPEHKARELILNARELREAVVAHLSSRPPSPAE
ncbi:MAG: HEPN domain-containing protein [Desulfuromonadales bacterium]|nr:MAG: HEPN domain-containing protein [Desulfuromonadales bacterium]